MLSLFAGDAMPSRALKVWCVVVFAMSSSAWAQARPANSKEPVSSGRPLSQWIAELKAPAPQTRNEAAYELARMGADAAPAVPALIEALDDPIPAVRYPVTIALLEIGPAAKAAIPRLQQMMDEEINDEIAASARRALKRIDPKAVPRQ
jgi:HEAT repeat protein